MERTQNQKRSLGNALSILISCLLFGRETHASTTQSDPLLLPTRNGPCREDGALHWEYLFCRVQHPHRKDSIVFASSDQHGGLLFTEILLPIGIDIQIPFCVVED